jgi:hypothetical protein
MVTWSQQYTAKSTLLQQQPVYVLVILDHYGIVNAGGAANYFTIDVTYGFEEHPGPMLLFNRDEWELGTPYDWSFGAVTDTVYITRAQYGTQQATTSFRDSVGTIRAMFSTGTVTGADVGLDIKSGYMSMPSGLSQSLDLVNGRLSVDGVRVDIQDRNGDVTRIMRSNPLIGRQAVLFGGFTGMAFRDYAFLHRGRIDEVKIRDGGVYNITLDDPTRKLSKKLFGYLDTWVDGIAYGGVTDNDTNWTDELFGRTELSGTNSDQVGDGYYAGHHLKVDDEYVRLNTNGVDHGVIRGTLGTTAAAHSGGSDPDGWGAEVTLVVGVEDNPIDVLLALLLNDDSYTVTRDVSNADGFQLEWGSVNSKEWGPMGVGVKRADIDLESFETIRNDWFPDYMIRLIIARGENMKPFIEKHLLKPYGLCLYLNNSGQLALGIMRPALPVTSLTPTLNADDIVGIPEIRISSGDIVNEVTVNLDYDPVDREYDADPVTVLDAGSQSDYDYTGAIDINARGLVTGWFDGAGKATKLARRKRQRFSDPNPAVPLEVLISNKSIEPMSIVRVIHAGLPDPWVGTVGWDKYVMVVGKRIRWDTGNLILDVIDTGYGGKRYCTIAPSGTAAYVDATSNERQNYGFVSDSLDQMSDGTDGYQIM